VNTPFESIYVKHSDFSPRQALSDDNVQSETACEPRHANSSNAIKLPFDSSDLQFELDSDMPDHAFKHSSVPINTTNPFLDTYAPESVYQSTSTQLGIQYSSVQEGNVFSEGSITPTNSEQTNVFTPSSKSESKSSKPPPAPPIRRTSSISNPNAITIGTLKSAGISTNYDDMCKNLSLYDEINVLTKSMNDINYSLKYTDFTASPSSISPLGKFEKMPNSQTDSSDKSEYQSVKTLFENYGHLQSNSKSNEEDSQLPLPAPPPEAFLDNTDDANTSVVSLGAQNYHLHHHYNKITNVHREFLETLNSKLSQSPNLNSRFHKRRSSSQSGSEECDSSYSKSYLK